MLYTTFSPVVLFVNETRNILYIFYIIYDFAELYCMSQVSVNQALLQSFNVEKSGNFGESLVITHLEFFLQDFKEKLSQKKYRKLKHTMYPYMISLIFAVPICTMGSKQVAVEQFRITYLSFLNSNAMHYNAKYFNFNIFTWSVGLVSRRKKFIR